MSEVFSFSLHLLRLLSISFKIISVVFKALQIVLKYLIIENMEMYGNIFDYISITCLTANKWICKLLEQQENFSEAILFFCVHMSIPTADKKVLNRFLLSSLKHTNIHSMSVW